MPNDVIARQPPVFTNNPEDGSARKVIEGAALVPDAVKTPEDAVTFPSEVLPVTDT